MHDVGLQTYDEVLADSFELVDTAEPNKKYTKQGRPPTQTVTAPIVLECGSLPSEMVLNMPWLLLSIKTGTLGHLS